MLGTEPAIAEAYVKTGQVRIVFNPVLNHGDRSYVSHQAAECAGEQGRFWEFRALLFESQNLLWAGDIRATVKELATQAGLDTVAFSGCIDEARHYDTVDKQDAIRRAAGIRTQPTFDINGQLYNGFAPFEIMADVLDEALTTLE